MGAKATTPLENRSDKTIDRWNPGRNMNIQTSIGKDDYVDKTFLLYGIDSFRKAVDDIKEVMIHVVDTTAPINIAMTGYELLRDEEMRTPFFRALQELMANKEFVGNVKEKTFKVVFKCTGYESNLSASTVKTELTELSKSFTKIKLEIDCQYDTNGLSRNVAIDQKDFMRIEYDVIESDGTTRKVETKHTGVDSQRCKEIFVRLFNKLKDNPGRFKPTGTDEHHSESYEIRRNFPVYHFVVTFKGCNIINPDSHRQTGIYDAFVHFMDYNSGTKKTNSERLPSEHPLFIEIRCEKGDSVSLASASSLKKTLNPAYKQCPWFHRETLEEDSSPYMIIGVVCPEQRVYLIEDDKIVDDVTDHFTTPLLGDVCDWLNKLNKKNIDLEFVDCMPLQIYGGEEEAKRIDSRSSYSIFTLPGFSSKSKLDVDQITFHCRSESNSEYFMRELGKVVEKLQELFPTIEFSLVSSKHIHN